MAVCASLRGLPTAWLTVCCATAAAGNNAAPAIATAAPRSAAPSTKLALLIAILVGVGRPGPLHEFFCADQSDLGQLVALRGRQHTRHDVVVRTLVRPDVQLRLRIHCCFAAEVPFERLDARDLGPVPGDRPVEQDLEIDDDRWGRR